MARWIYDGAKLYNGNNNPSYYVDGVVEPWLVTKVDFYHCSVCGRKHRVARDKMPLLKFCWNCGEEMQ